MKKLTKQDQREWLIFTIILIIGMFLLQFVANKAVTAPPSWQVISNMQSNIDPDKNYTIQLKSGLAPILPEIITPPVWEMSSLLTVEPFEYKELVNVPLDNFFKTATPTAKTILPEIKVVISVNSQPANPGQVTLPTTNFKPTSPPSMQSSPTLTAPTKTPVGTNVAAQGASPTPTSTKTIQFPISTSTQASQITPTYTPTSTIVTGNIQPTIAPQPTKAPNSNKPPKPPKPPKPTKPVPPGKNK